MNRWPSVAIKRVARLGTGHTPSRQHPEYWENCTIPWLTLADVWQLRDGTRSVVNETSEMISELGVRNSSAVLHPAGSVALSRTASVGFSCILGRSMATSQDFAVWTCGPRLHPRFLLWVLRGSGDAISERMMGSTHKTIYMPDIETLRTPLPPMGQQEEIADFLDRATARIDSLVAAKRRLVELLDERWSSTVRAAVTGSLTGSTFPIVPLKRLWTVVDCKHRTPDYTVSGFPVVSPGDVTPGRLDLSRCARFVGQADFEDLTRDGRRPKSGDIIYSRNASIGIAALVSDDEPFTMGQDVCLITSKDQDQRFLTYCLNTVGLDQLDEAKVGSTFSRVNISQIRDLMVPGPASSTQAAVADRLDQLALPVDEARRLLLEQLALLSEHRQALITAAVTGEFHMQGLAA